MTDTFARLCRTCGFAHTQQDEACPRWSEPMFDTLTREELDELFAKVSSGIHRACRFAQYVAGDAGQWNAIHEVYAEAMVLQKELCYL